jgi:hypothetical protein
MSFFAKITRDGNSGWTCNPRESGDSPTGHGLPHAGSASGTRSPWETCAGDTGLPTAVLKSQP